MFLYFHHLTELQLLATLETSNKMHIFSWNYTKLICLCISLKCTIYWENLGQIWASITGAPQRSCNICMNFLQHNCSFLTRVTSARQSRERCVRVKHETWETWNHISTERLSRPAIILSSDIKWYGEGGKRAEAAGWGTQQGWELCWYVKGCSMLPVAAVK